MKKTILILIMAITVSGCTTKTTKNNNPKNIDKDVPTEKNIKSSPSQSPLVFQQKKCVSLRNFANKNWFKEMVALHKDEIWPYEVLQYILSPQELSKYYTNQELSELYVDDLCKQEKGCLYSNYFIFVPFETVGATGAIYKYNLKTKRLTKAPGSSKYLKDELIEINDKYVSFSGGGGTGECFWENYGKYYFKDNKIEIYKTCNGCATKEELSQGSAFSFKDKDCKNVIKIYK